MSNEDENRIRVQVSVDDLMSHFNTINDNSAITALAEAVSFAKAHNGNLKFWTCCLCDEKFDRSGLHWNHVIDTHMSSLSRKHLSVVPIPISSDWHWMILHGSWKPIHTSAAYKTLQEQQYELLCSKPDEAFNVTIDESEEDPLKKRARKYYLTQNWPLSDDSVREKMLWTVSKVFKFLLIHNYLTKSHVDKVISYTMKELTHLVPGLDVELLCLDQTHMCICFLEAPQLQKVIDFLTDLYRSSTKSSDNKYNVNDMVKPSTLSVNNEVNVVLNGDSFTIFLDEYSLNSHDCENRETPNDDALLRWTFTGPSSEEELESWRRLENERKIQGKELIQTCEQYFGTVRNLVEEKCNQLCYKEALELIWDCYICELWRRAPGTHPVARSFEEILKGIQKDSEYLAQYDLCYPLSYFDLYCDLKSRSQDSHIMKAISSVLKKPQTNVMPEKSLIGCTTGVFDYKNLPEIHLRAVRIQADNYLEEAVKREGENNDTELQKTDARIIQTAIEMETMMFGINSFAAADFQAVLLPLVKSYMQAQKEKLAHENITAEPVTAMITSGNEQGPLLKQTAENWLVSCSAPKGSRLRENSDRQ